MIPSMLSLVAPGGDGCGSGCDVGWERWPASGRAGRGAVSVLGGAVPRTYPVCRLLRGVRGRGLL
jgi:hypothetical protein